MHEITVRVYYEDTDMAGVVYYANYLRYLERGRTELLRDLGADQTALKAGGLVFVVRHLTIDYLAPARFDDVLCVTTGFAEVRGASAVMDQDIRCGGRHLIRARVTVACMDTDGTPRRLPTELRANFVQGPERG